MLPVFTQSGLALLARLSAMPLVAPKLVVLDLASLGNASRDYWSREQLLRGKARRFLADLTERGVYVAITLTHVSELLRYHDEHVVRDRLRFLRAIPLIVWLRPYNRRWFPGGVPDLLRRELHAVVHADKRDWPMIVEHVRADLWETGSGSEIVVDDDRMWFKLRQEFLRQHHDELLIASIRRTDPGQTDNLTVSESERLPRRSKEERTAFMPRFAADLREQLERHGDPRLESKRATIGFLNSTMHDMQIFEQAGGDPIQRLLEHYDVPKDLVTPDMTVSELGQLAVYIKQLKLLSRGLWPPVRVTARRAVGHSQTRRNFRRLGGRRATPDQARLSGYPGSRFSGGDQRQCGFERHLPLALGGLEFLRISRLDPIERPDRVHRHIDPTRGVSDRVGRTARRGMTEGERWTICTSHVERLNGTQRLFLRWLNRLTYAFSKKLRNLEAAFAMFAALQLLLANPQAG